ncbi:ABC transporter substrate-binding protein [Fusibacter bizertensis]
MNFGRFVKIIVPLMIIVMLSTSCELSNDTIKPTNPPKQDEVEQELISNPALSRSGALIVAAPDIDSTFNPLFASKDVEKWISDLVFDGLFAFADTDELKGVLAETYVVSEDGLKYTIDLKSNVTFHDGSMMSPDDILFTYEIILDPLYKGTYSSIRNDLIAVEKTGANQIIFTFKNASRDNLNVFDVPILSMDYYDFDDIEAFEKSYKIPMGTGAFSFNEYDLGDSIVLVKNTHYFLTNAKISGIVIRKYSELDAYNAFIEGKIDIFEISPSKYKVENVNQLDFGNVLTQGRNITVFIGLDLTNPILSELKVRKALLYGLDRQAFIQTEWSGYSDVVNFIATDVDEFSMDAQLLETYEYNLDKASELLDSTGWKDSDEDGFREKNGERLTLKYTVFPESDWSYNLGQFVQSQWRKLGIEVNLDYLDYSGMLETLSSDEKLNLWNLGWIIEVDQNPELLFSSEAEKGIYNFSGFDDAVSNALFNDLHNAKSGYEKKTILTKWHFIQNEQLPVLPIARLKSVWAYNSRVKNLKINAYGSWTDQIINMDVEVLH